MYRKLGMSNKLIAPVLVAMVVFLACAPAMSRMTCLMSGRSVVTVGPSMECCPAEPASNVPVIKGVCCAFSAIQPPDTEYVPVTAMTVSCPVTAGIPLSASTVQLVPLKLARTYPCRPPPGSMAERLASLQVYRI